MTAAMVTLRFNDDPWAQTLYAGLKKTGVADKDLDIGYSSVNYVKMTQTFSGKGDGVIESAEVYEFVLSHFRKYQELWQTITHLNVPWVAPSEKERSLKFREYEKRLDRIYSEVKDILKRAGIDDQDPRFFKAVILSLSLATGKKEKPRQVLQAMTELGLKSSLDLLEKAGRFPTTEGPSCGDYDSLIDYVEKDCRLDGTFRELTLNELVSRAGVTAESSVSHLKGNDKISATQIVRLPSGSSFFLKNDDAEWRFPSNRYFLASWFMMATQKTNDPKSAQYGAWATAIRRLIPDAPDAHLIYGSWLFLKQEPDFANARAELKTALQQSPDNPEVHLYLGHLHLLNREWEEALKEYQWVVDSKAPDQIKIDALEKTMAAAGKTKRTERAIEAVRRLVTLDPKNISRRRQLAFLLETNNDTKQAVKVMESAARASPRDISNHLYLGWLYRQTGQFDSALRAYRRAMQLDPKNEKVFLGLSASYREKGNLSKALGFAEKAYRLDPTNNEEIKIEYVQVLRGTQHLQDCLKVLDEMEAKIGSGQVWIHAERGVCLLMMGKPKEAIVHLEHALAIDPTLEDIRFALGMTLFTAQNVPAAAEILSKINIANLSPNNRIQYSILFSQIFSDQGKLDEALDTAKKTTAQAPLNPAVWWQLANVYEQREEYEEGIKTVRQIQKLEPLELGLNLWIALFHMKAGRYQEALRLAQSVLKESKEKIMQGLALAMIGELHHLQGRNDQTLADYRKAKELAPDFLPAQINLGLALLKHNDLDEAEAEFRAACKETRMGSEGYRGLGDVLMSRKRYAEAIAQYQHAVQLDPENAYARNGLGNAFYMRDDLKQAADNYLEVSALEPEKPEGHHNLGATYYRMHDYISAAKAFERAIAIDDNDMDSHDYLYRCYDYLGQNADALAALRRIESRKKNSPEFYFRLYRTLKDLGDAPEAKQALKKVEILDPQSSLPEVAEIHQALHRLDFKTVRQLAEAMLRRNLNGSIAYAYLAAASAEEKDYPNALKLAEKSIALDGEQSFAYNTLGWAYLQQGRRKEAIEAFEKSLEIDPGEPVSRNNLKMARSQEIDLSKIKFFPEETPKIPEQPPPKPQQHLRMDRRGWNLPQKREGIDIWRQGEGPLPDIIKK